MAENNSVADTLEKIESGSATIGVIGLGYVGLPLALAFASKLSVIGYELDPDRRTKLRNGISYMDDVADSSIQKAVGKSLRIADESSDLRGCDAIIVCVPTPLDERGSPDLSHVSKAAEIIQSVVQEGMLIVLESTSYPGTTEEYLGRAIKNAGYKPGEEVALAFSPERVDPGNKRYNISNTPKIVGGMDEMSADLAVALYSMVVDAGVVRVRDCKTAEASKIVENIFRGVNIALMNELALIFERMGIDTWEVVRAASTKPFAFMPHFPGPGVGGHCIPLDPLYLSYKAKQFGIIPRFIELSREVNEFMKFHTVNLAISALDEAGINAEDATVAVMGVAYKRNISDTRESPAIDILSELSKMVKVVEIHDPRVQSIMTPSGEFRTQSIDQILRSADCLIFVTDHHEYTELGPEQLKGAKVKAIVDTRNIFDGHEVSSIGIVYKGIGKPEVGIRT